MMLQAIKRIYLLLSFSHKTHLIVRKIRHMKKKQPNPGQNNAKSDTYKETKKKNLFLTIQKSIIAYFILG